MLCCHVKGKPIQIHHIDENPANNEPENLAVLCLECHNETQIRGGFGRKLNSEQVTLYRDDWLTRVAKTRATHVEKDELPSPQQIDREQSAYKISLKEAKRERLRFSYKVLLHTADKYRFEAQQFTHMPNTANITLTGVNEAITEISLEGIDTDVLSIFYELQGAFHAFCAHLNTPGEGTWEDVLKQKRAVTERYEQLKTAMFQHLKELES